MSVLEFAKALDLDTCLLLEDFNYSKPLAFTQCVLERLKDSLGLNDYTIAYDNVKSSNGNVLGEIFGYSLSENKEVLTLFYSLYNDEISQGVKNIISSDFQKIPNRMQGYYLYCQKGTVVEELAQDHPLYELADALHKIETKPKFAEKYPINSVRLIVFSNSILNNDKPNKLRINGKHVTIETYGIDRLYTEFGKQTDHQNIDVLFGEGEDEFNYRIPYIKMEAPEINYECYMAMFPGKLLKNLYEQYNTNLLLNNVRYFLGFKGTAKNNANVDIQNTLRNEKHMFLAYNNGIVALADSVETEEEGLSTTMDRQDSEHDQIKSGIISAIRDFQIVNGGQTTASLYYAKQQGSPGSISLKGVYVPVKIIVIKEGTEKKNVAAKVTKYSNSQNKVKYADFSASNPFNMEMEHLSRTVRTSTGKCWFYERLRGQYDQEYNRNKTKEDQQVFNNLFDKKTRLFKKELLAKAWKCYLNHPYDVVKGEGTNYDLFLRYVVENGIQPDEEYFKKSVALIILWNYIYSMDEVKRMGNSRAPLTAYILAYMLNCKGQPFNLIKIWDKQQVDDPNLIKFLQKLATSITIQLNELASGSGKSVLSVSKNQGTYTELKSRGVYCETSLIKDYFA